MSKRCNKKLSDFKGYTKQEKYGKALEYLKQDWVNILLSYIFIFLSSSLPFFDRSNGAIYVLIWYSIVQLLSIYAFVSHSDNEFRRGKAVNFERNHKTVVNKGYYIKPEIGGWNLVGMSVMCSFFFCTVLSIFSLDKQFRDYDQYMSQDIYFYIGLFADTCIVAFFSLAYKLIVEFICDYMLNHSLHKEMRISLKVRDVISGLAVTSLALAAMIYYFDNEFGGLFEKAIVRRTIGVLYILFMIYPGIKQIIYQKRNCSSLKHRPQ